MKQTPDDKIISCWQNNAKPWIEAIRNQEIHSRVLVTNQAIVETITRLGPDSVLDIGCGEGWLVRALCQRGVDCLGIDVVPELIDYARKTGEGRFRTLSYQQLASQPLHEKFGLAVGNFSLLGYESVVEIFTTIPSLLTTNGYFIVQTLHPESVCGNHPYADGWREGSWDGFSENFRDPAPWYFRTLPSWQGLFLDHGFTLHDIREPVNPQTGQAASVIFVGQITASNPDNTP